MSAITPLVCLDGHRSAVLCLRYAQDSFLGQHILASGSEDSTCRLWDLRQARAVKGIQKLPDAVTSIAFSSSQKPYVYLASSNKVFAYDLRNDGLIFTVPAHEYAFNEDEINCIDVRDHFLATADDQGEVRVVDLEKNTIYKKMIKKHSNICMAVKFRSKKPWEDVSETRSGQQMFNPPFIYALDTSKDGQWIAAGLGDCSIQLLHEAGKKTKRKEIRIEEAHTYMVNCISFVTPASKNASQQLLSGSANGSVKLWELAHGETPYEQKASYQIDPASMAKLNWLEPCTMEPGHIAAAGVGAASNTGTLHIYSIV
ncbi:WD40-repeat-containing domain protein [Dichotomocladium elegans]|nr:WD40-repeat-containing domain protein [Dichotomocladium elegans]